MRNLEHKQQVRLEEITFRIERLMDMMYPDRSFLIPEDKDVLEFIQGFADLYQGDAV